MGLEDVMKPYAAAGKHINKEWEARHLN